MSAKVCFKKDRVIKADKSFRGTYGSFKATLDKFLGNTLGDSPLQEGLVARSEPFYKKSDEFKSEILYLLNKLVKPLIKLLIL